MKCTYLTTLILLLLCGSLYAQDEVLPESQEGLMPEIQLGLRGVGSGNLDITDGGDAASVADFSDTQFILGFRQKLFKKWRARMVMGFQFPDVYDLGTIYYNQIFVSVENQKNAFKVGRTTATSFLIEGHTLRDDDALPFLYTLNPFAEALYENTQDNQYANVLEYRRIIRQRFNLKVHGEYYDETNEELETDREAFSFNSYGAAAYYRVPESQRFNRNILQQIGFNYNVFMTDNEEFEGQTIDENLVSYTGSLVLNVIPDPTHFVDFRSQVIFNEGISSINDEGVFDNYYSYTRSKSVQYFGGIGYVYKDLDFPKVRASVSVGYRSFPDLDSSENQWQLVANTFYRLGYNFDVGLQYQYLKNNGVAENLFFGERHRFQVAFIYNVNLFFNKMFDDRNSILNLEHGFVK